METAQLSVLLGLLSQWMERLGASAVMEAAVSENPRDPAVMAVSPPAEMALSLSSVGMDVLVVMTATGTVAILPPTEVNVFDEKRLSNAGFSLMFTCSPMVVS